jgi:hypothetical protein
MPMILKTLIVSLVSALANKHVNETIDKPGGITTQLATLPAVAGMGAITVTEFSTETDLFIAVISTLVSVVLYFYRSRRV